MDLLKKYGVIAGFVVIAIACLMAFDVQTRMAGTPIAILGLALVIVGKR